MCLQGREIMWQWTTVNHSWEKQYDPAAWLLYFELLENLFDTLHRVLFFFLSNSVQFHRRCQTVPIASSQLSNLLCSHLLPELAGLALIRCPSWRSGRDGEFEKTPSVCMALELPRLWWWEASPAGRWPECVQCLPHPCGCTDTWFNIRFMG